MAEIFFKICDNEHQTVPVNAQDKLGNTPLYLSLKSSHVQTFLLLMNGADPNLANAEGTTPLHIICQQYHNNDLAELFFYLNDVNQQTVQIKTQDKLGDTPLHLALCYGQKKAAYSLLRRGVIRI
uniref:Uncharacterized protein n=1 Tax=Trichogramma kaykai TaxID=54128 RepID=A0ABD2VSG7_9HYME